jgi:hypothetical protein
MWQFHLDRLMCLPLFHLRCLIVDHDGNLELLHEPLLIIFIKGILAVIFKGTGVEEVSERNLLCNLGSILFPAERFSELCFCDDSWELIFCSIGKLCEGWSIKECFITH